MNTFNVGEAVESNGVVQFGGRDVSIYQDETQSPPIEAFVVDCDGILPRVHDCEKAECILPFSQVSNLAKFLGSICRFDLRGRQGGRVIVKALLTGYSTELVGKEWQAQFDLSGVTVIKWL